MCLSTKIDIVLAIRGVVFALLTIQLILCSDHCSGLWGSDMRGSTGRHSLEIEVIEGQLDFLSINHALIPTLKFI